MAVAIASGCTPEQVAFWSSAHPEDRSSVTEHVIRTAADEFGVDGDFMIKLALCEGGLVNPANKNRVSTATGPFQYLDTTWARARTRLYDRGIDPAPYSEADRLNPVAQARITANVLSEGGLSWWDQSRPCWSK